MLFPVTIQLKSTSMPSSALRAAFFAAPLKWPRSGLCWRQRAAFSGLILARPYAAALASIRVRRNSERDGSPSIDATMTERHKKLNKLLTVAGCTAYRHK